MFKFRSTCKNAGFNAFLWRKLVVASVRENACNNSKNVVMIFEFWKKT